jgi:transcriptional regulator with XRE-family HTH domain
MSEGAVAIDADETLRAIGRRIRALRSDRRLTLNTVAERTGLSVSLLSMVERGVTAPSIGTLVAIAGCFGVHMSDLFSEAGREVESDPVTRREDQPTFETAEGVLRRVAQTDDPRGFEMAVNEYAPGTSSNPTSTRHEGVEFGVVIEGTLTVELDGREYSVGPGDSISYESGRPHRLRNDGAGRVRAVWLNFAR